MKQQRTLIVLAVAVIAAGVAAYGVYSAVQSMPVREVEVASSPCCRGRGTDSDRHAAHGGSPARCRLARTQPGAWRLHGSQAGHRSWRDFDDR